MTIALSDRGPSPSRISDSANTSSPKAKPPIAAWLCLRFAYLPLNAVGVRFEDHSNAVITQDYKVCQANQNAEEYGIDEGLSVGHALMFNPLTQLTKREPERESEQLKSLSEWAYRFTSHVCVYDDHTLLLEIGRSLSLFRGLKHLQHLIDTQLDQMGFDVFVGVAKTPKAAHVLSYGYQPQQTSCAAAKWNIEASEHLLKHAYLGDLSLTPKTITQLQNCGLSTVSDLLAIPTDELAARFGQDTTQYLDQLFGRTADPQIFTTPPETFTANVDFAEPISNRLWIEQQINRLLHDLLKFVESRQLLCRGFEWRFYHEDSRLLHAIEINVNSTKLDLKMLQQLTDLKLASSAMQWEFASIELSSDQLFEKSLWHDDLFDPRPDQEAFNRLIDRLNSRLGSDAVRQLQTQAEHLPELASGSQTMSSVEIEASTTSLRKPRKAEGHTSIDVTHDLIDEPLWLLEHPRRLSMQTDGKPLCDGPLAFIHGPNRVSSHWWSKLQSRDYYIARQASGRLLWVYFERSHRVWYMHGAFA